MLGLTMYNPPSHFFKASSACRKLPHHGVTVEVTAMLSQAASPEQLGGVGGGWEIMVKDVVLPQSEHALVLHTKDFLNQPYL